MIQVAWRKKRLHLKNFNMGNFIAVVLAIFNGVTLQNNMRQKNDVSLFRLLGQKRKLIGKISLINFSFLVLLWTFLKIQIKTWRTSPYRILLEFGKVCQKISFQGWKTYVNCYFWSYIVVLPIIKHSAAMHSH